jgi:hypothetical protein
MFAETLEKLQQEMSQTQKPALYTRRTRVRETDTAHVSIPVNKLLQ